jgi:hypothetical protein
MPVPRVRTDIDREDFAEILSVKDARKKCLKMISAQLCLFARWGVIPNKEYIMRLKAEAEEGCLRLI